MKERDRERERGREGGREMKERGSERERDQSDLFTIKWIMGARLPSIGEEGNANKLWEYCS